LIHCSDRAVDGFTKRFITTTDDMHVDVVPVQIITSDVRAG